MKTIQLTQGYSTVVDDDDFESLNSHKWYYNSGYAVRWESKVKRVKMHRVVTKAPNDKQVDHIDHDTLNNQKSNLRFCTTAQNLMNSKKKKGNSKYKGVSLLVRRINGKEYRYYRSRILINNKSIETVFKFSEEGEILAALDYNEKAKKYFGEFANLNII